MKMNGHLHKILANYVSDNPATTQARPRPVQQLKAQPLSR
jgi:hypothetical protein